MRRTGGTETRLTKRSRAAGPLFAGCQHYRYRWMRVDDGSFLYRNMRTTWQIDCSTFSCGGSGVETFSPLRIKAIRVNPYEFTTLTCGSTHLMCESST
jgi:hypothetical protein